MEKLKAGFSRLDITPPLGVFVDGYYNDRLSLIHILSVPFMIFAFGSFVLSG